MVDGQNHQWNDIGPYHNLYLMSAVVYRRLQDMYFGLKVEFKFETNLKPLER